MQMLTEGAKRIGEWIGELLIDEGRMQRTMKSWSIKVQIR